MKPMHRFFSPLLASTLLAPALLLSGCGGNVSFPDTVVPGTAQQTPLGTIKGSVYGGHAPLTAAHVYVLQPSTTGYGNQATSLLSSTEASSAPGYATFKNTSDPGIPTSWYYIETDGSGQYNITGDYTCTAGVPVYLYSYGGYADYPQSNGYGTNNTFGISGVSISGSGPYTYTFTTTTAQYGYAGETVYFNQTYGPFTGGSDYTMASWLSPTSFTLTSSTSSTSSTSGLQANIIPDYNDAVVELAVLGVCPSSGNFATGGTLFNGSTFSPLNYVYMNEVSTVAAAYAFAPFSANGYSFSSTTNNATYIGTSTTNLVGLQNAALNAGLLYSVNGSGAISTTYAGEGHIANATTPGHGIINNVVIDTLANILASCVDSLNSATTPTVGASGVSTQCSTLFQYATSTGIPTTDPNPGIQPYDTATAAINIALHPQGPPSTDTTTTPAAWVAALYNLPTGVVPFAPNLTDQPNDFTIGILYTAANTNNGNILYLQGATYVAVDKIGEVWIGPDIAGSGSNTGYITPLSPQGNVIFSETAFLPNNYVPGPLVIDANSNVWTQPQNVQAPTYFIRATSTSGNPYVYANTVTAATPDSEGYFYTGAEAYFGDKSGNMYFVHDSVASSDTTHAPAANFQLSEYPAITSPTNVPTDAGEVAIATLLNTENPISAAVLDEGGYMWVTQNAGSSGTSTVERTGGVPNNVNQTPIFSLAGSGNCAGIDAPTSLALTRGSNAIMANSVEYAVTFVTSGGTCSFIQNSTGTAINRTGPGSYFPVAEATDGNDYVYSLNQEAPAEGLNYHQGSITVFNLQQETASGIYALNYAWSPVYYPSGSSTLTSLLSYPQSMALDPSGNIWVVNSTTQGNNPNSVVEIIGAAGPTSTPLSSSICAYTTGCYSYRP